MIQIERRYHCPCHDVLHGGPIPERVRHVSTLLTHPSVHSGMLLQRRYWGAIRKGMISGAELAEGPAKVRALFG